MEGLGGGQYAGETAKYDGPSQLRRVTIREEVLGQIKHHEECLKTRKEMLDLLDRNPDIEKFINLSRSY